MKLKMRDLRKARQVTQEELADAIGETKRVIGAWEREDTPMPFDAACLIADFLECTLDDLAGRSSDVRFFDKRQQQINDDYARLSEPLKDAAASSIHGMMLSESARALEERPETDTRCQAS